MVLQGSLGHHIITEHQNTGRFIWIRRLVRAKDAASGQTPHIFAAKSSCTPTAAAQCRQAPCMVLLLAAVGQFGREAKLQKK